MVEYQSKPLQWVRFLMIFFIFLGTGIIGYKVVAPTSKDTYKYEAGARSEEKSVGGTRLFDGPLIQGPFLEIGGCAGSRETVRRYSNAEEVRK